MQSKICCICAVVFMQFLFIKYKCVCVCVCVLFVRRKDKHAQMIEADLQPISVDNIQLNTKQKDKHQGGRYQWMFFTSRR